MKTGQMLRWDKLVCNSHYARDLVLHLLHFDLLVYLLDLDLHASLIGRDLIADLALLSLTLLVVIQLCLELFDASLGMLTVFRELPGFAAAFLTSDFSI